MKKDELLLLGLFALIFIISIMAWKNGLAASVKSISESSLPWLR